MRKFKIITFTIAWAILYLTAIASWITSKRIDFGVNFETYILLGFFMALLLIWFLLWNFIVDLID